uniref:protein-glutamine gamma-glutamyltransferase n=1 Tax=Phallusia mammillata TaxID=59560 RepID=A0A6F9DU27_9ASCI|nr:transglutaminase [Phallusia mammillata]
MLAGQDDATQKISVDLKIPPKNKKKSYKLTVEVTSELETGMKTERTTKPDIIVIFNPFSPTDNCYMENSADRDEYVLNDTGKIYFGQWYRIGGKDWLFGQFEEGILDIALKLLRKDSRAIKNPEKSLKKRASPAYCSRVLSAMVNCNDDDGIIWGNWSGDYADGKSPTSWSGSVQIMKQWNETNEAVKYGQCWVFSGVLTTALRALGIPARSITNYRSAHDTEYNMTIDKFIGEDGEETNFTSDSIWNFHVWNEGWFRRPDLPKGYDGWQAVDATPQEESSGIMQCGPAPVKAVQKGEIYIGTDTNFLFGEVNADVVWWSVDAGGEVTGMLKRDKRDVGKRISTKAVGSDEREDVTKYYKFEEDTPEERTAFERAYAHGRKADYHDKFVIKEEGAMQIDITTGGDTMNGKPISVKIVVNNTTKENRDVIVTTVMHTLLNNENRCAFIKRDKREVAIAAGQANEQDIVLAFGEYGHRLVDENVIRVTTTARVKQTNNLYVDTFDLQVDSPPGVLTIECADTFLRREYSEISFTITNPLPITLTDGVFTIVGSGVTNGKTVKANGPIGPGETFKSQPVEVYPYRSGRTYLYADFDATEFKNVKAAKAIRVE